MNRSVLTRIIEAFFRNRVLYLVPLFLLVALGFLNAGKSNDEYTSNGVVFVDRGSLVTDLTSVQAGGGVSFLTPAQFTSQELNGLLQTDVFLMSVIEAAGIGSQSNVVARSNLIATARDSITSFATSENLLLVQVTVQNPQLAEALALATITEFIDFKVELDIAESSAAQTFFEQLVADYELDLLAAQDEIDTYLQSLPEELRSIATLGETGAIAGIAGLTPEQQQRITRLTDAETAARARLDKALADLEASRLAELQADTDVRQSIFLVDPPQAAQEPNSGLTTMVIIIAMYSLVGLGITLLGPVLAALMNRGVLLPEDLKRIPGASVIAVIPSASRGDLKLAKAEVPDYSAVAVPPDLRRSTPVGDADESDAFENEEVSDDPKSRWARA